MLKSKIFVGSLVGATVFSAIILSSSTVSAETYTKSALIRVQAACTMDGTVTTAHSATIAGGTYREGIGESIVSVACNDAGGFGVYAIGFTGDTDGNNVLAHGTEDVSIATGTATSGNTSNWAMKLEAYENGNNTPTIENGYGSYKAVPDDYTLVASYPNATSATDDVIFRTYYSAYIAMTQRAGTYTGKVKYVMVHPSTGAAPEKQISFDTAYAAAGKAKVVVGTSSYYKLQDMNSSICGTVTKKQTTELVDTRDNTIYHVGKLLDNHCWLLDNLALDLVDANVQTNINPGNTNASATALDALFGVSNRNSSTDPDGNLATAGVAEWGSYSYTVPFIDSRWKDDVNSSDSIEALRDSKYGIYYNYCAASAGFYCYDSGKGRGEYTDRTAIDTEYDICPAGWRLPTGSYYESYYRPEGGDLYYLARAYSETYFSSALTEEPGYTDFRTAFRLPLSGYHIFSYPLSQGESGGVWSSTIYDTTRAYYINVGTSSVSCLPQRQRNNAFSVRCIAK